MLELALGNNSWIKLDTWEAMKDEWTLTLEVLRHHRAELKNIYGSDVQLMFLCGGDLVESFLVPGVWKDEHVSLQRPTPYMETNHERFKPKI